MVVRQYPVEEYHYDGGSGGGHDHGDDRYPSHGGGSSWGGGGSGGGGPPGYRGPTSYLSYLYDRERTGSTPNSIGEQNGNTSNGRLSTTDSVVSKTTASPTTS
ncbi:hypothetical protein L9F63_025794 [Diploptera punctata]|uniref:Uncharacterized protein n=1 Tax=Diploptera punctata TaxID=6984 RepID=A0AAD7Z7F3_DIPPU|nr:hypothetical protein L9F63_025794 [Diploptera punctata]